MSLKLPRHIPPTLTIRFRKDGEVDNRWKGAHHKPSNAHPWKKPWVETPEGYQRAINNGYKSNATSA